MNLKVRQTLFREQSSSTCRRGRRVERKTSLQITRALQNSCVTLLNPWFITGFADAEASFSILIQHNAKFNTNWRVKAIFSIGLHIKDLVLLESLRQTLGVGNIHKPSLPLRLTR